MSEITQITDYSSNLTLILEQYKESDLLKDLIDIMNNQADDLEQALFEIRDEFWLNVAIGNQLDILGGIFGLARKGMSDSDYRTALIGKAALITSGEPETIITLLKLLYEATYVDYWGSFPVIPAGFYLHTDAEITMQELERISPAGVQPYLIGRITQGVFTLLLDDETTTFVSNITALATDGEYFYFNMSGDQFVRKFHTATMTQVAISASHGQPIRCIAVDDDSVYVSGGASMSSSHNRVYKLDKTDLSKICESARYGSSVDVVYCLSAEYDYVYVGGSDTTAAEIWQLNKSDLTLNAQGDTDYPYEIYDIVEDGTHIYICGYSTRRIWKYLKSTMIYQSQSALYNTPKALAIDNTYVYMAGEITGTVRQYLKSTLVLQSESASYGNIYSMEYNDGSIFIVDNTTYKIHRLSVVDLSEQGESANYYDTVTVPLYLAVTNGYVLLGTVSATLPPRVVKLIKDSRDHIIDANGNKLFHVANP